MGGIFKYSHFEADEFGHGGNKRSAQIDELLNNAGISFTTVDFTPFLVKGNKLLLYLSGLLYSRNIFNKLRNNYATGRYIKQFRLFIADKKPDLFILEATADYNILLIKLLSEQNIPIVAMPHNIESLVKDTENAFLEKKAPEWLLDEISYLKECRRVFSISREEAWLLSNFNVNASYLPYYPTANVKNWLLNIRKNKQIRNAGSLQSKNILLLGTFYNIPTYSGYLALIDAIQHIGSININVAGYGSERLHDPALPGNIKIWGSLSLELLEKLFVDCDLAIIHQEPTSGALTRIPELLIAGLPILANTSASRSYANTEGLYVYHNMDDLAAFINEDLPTPPVPLQPIEETNFIKYIKSFS